MNEDIREHLEKCLEKIALTKRNRQIALDILHGLSNKQIAKIRNITVKTTKLYVTAIYKKVNVKTRSEYISKMYQMTMLKLIDKKLTKGKNGNF